MKLFDAKFGLFVFLFIGIFGFLSLIRPASTAVNTNTTVLYDATQGGLPASQNMSYASYGEGFVPTSSTQTFTNGATVLDSTAKRGDYAGYGVDPAEAGTYDAADGFGMAFTVRIEEEAYTDTERSGFSIILLDKNAIGIEIGFHEDTVYAREGNGTDLFDVAESVTFDTTTETTYYLEIIDDSYTLTATGMPTLTGSTRDYSDNPDPPFNIPDPYEQPNFVFLGDNTTRAEAIIHLKYVAILTDTVAPTPTATHTATATATSTPDPDDPGAEATPEAIESYLPLITKP
ncbi:MAG: hypothetical protein AAF490_11820 [Chloroflexota bacterium]